MTEKVERNGTLEITAMLERVDGMVHVDLLDSPAKYRDQVMLYRIRYRSDDCEVEGYLSFPGDAMLGKRFYGLIFNRGGNRDYAPLRSDSVCRYAAHGYVCIGSQYRGNMGGTGREEFGGADVNDVIRLIDLLYELPFVKRKGVFMVGRSRGGMMTYLACSRDPRIIAAAILAGVSNCFTMYDRFHGGEYDMREDMEALIGGSPAELGEEYRKRSAVFWAERIMPPLVICQGTSDWRVIPEQAIQMRDALEKAGKEYVFHLYEGADHSLDHTTCLYDVLTFFRRFHVDDTDVDAVG